MLIYDWLRKLGFANEVAGTEDDRKQAFARYMQRVARGFVNKYEAYHVQRKGTDAPELDFTAYEIARDKEIARTFDRMIADELQIDNYLDFGKWNKITIDCIIGIDPGKNGGDCCLASNHKTEVIKMPGDLMELRQWFDYMKSICRPLVFVEKVQLRPDDVNDNPGKAFRVQKLLSEFEKLKTIIAMCDVPFVLVHPKNGKMNWNCGLRERGKAGAQKAIPTSRRRLLPRC